MKIFIILTIFLKPALSDDNFDLPVNSKCISSLTGANGVCMEPKNCDLFSTHKFQLKICSFSNRTPIVCCNPKSGNHNNQRISAKKCEEYTKFSELNSTTRFVRSAPQNDNDFVLTFVGGLNAVKNQFPHMSAIGWRLNYGKIEWKCGGSLISEKFVLSAAHCIVINEGKPSIVRVGDLDLTKDDDGVKPQEFSIKKIITHPLYKKELNYHDIVLFELVRVAIFSESVLPACLHQEDDDLSNYALTGMGWGATEFAGKSSDILKHGFLSIMKNEECQKKFGNALDSLPQGITSSQICAWDETLQRDTCTGDSGGPLQITKTTANNNKFYEIIGVTSFGVGCGNNFPGVYVKVSDYLDWIEGIVWKK